MLTTNDHTLTISGNVGDNAQAMTIDPEAMQHIMQVLTRMYSDNRAAVVREYVANALDSHTEAGQTRPVEVTTPSYFEPKLVVRDYGVGLDRDGLLKVYSVYGKSTRRESNEGIGGFGIGSKAGFTLSGQFVVTGIKNGVKTVALFSLDENGAPTVEILAEKNTDEDNGVTVAIAVDDVDKVCAAVNKLSPVWPKGKVLVDGREPQCIYDSATEVSKDIFLADTTWGFTVDMGGVPYRVNSTMLTDIQNTLEKTDIARVAINRITRGNTGIIARLPIGSVSIAPNRESLSNTGKTQKALTAILRSVAEDQEKAIQKALISSRDVFAAFDSLRPFIGIVGLDYLQNLRYRYEPLKTITFPDDSRSISLGYSRGKHKAQLNHSSQYSRLRIEAFKDDAYYERFIFITDVPEADNSKVLRIATRYLVANDRKIIILTDQPSGSVGWFRWGGRSKITCMTLAEFRAITSKLPSLSTRNEVTYDYYTLTSGGSFEWLRDTGTRIGENAEGKIYHTHGAGTPNTMYKRILDVGDVIVTLTGQKKAEPLEKRLGQPSIHLDPLWKKYVADYRNNLSDMDKMAVGFNTRLEYSRVQKLLSDGGYHSDVLDAIVNDYTAAKSHVETMDAEEVAFLRNIAYDVAVDTSLEERYDEWASRYVLVDSMLRQQVRYQYRYDPKYYEHMAEYMTAIDSKEEN